MENRKTANGIKVIIISLIWAAIMIAGSYLWEEFSNKYAYLIIAAAYVHTTLLSKNNLEYDEDQAEDKILQ